MRSNYTIIDAHCHIYPEKVASRAVASTDEFYNTHANGTGLIQNLIALGDEAGYDGYVVQSVASTPHHVGSINRFIAGVVTAAEAEGRRGVLTGLGTMHPDLPDMKEAVEEILSFGLHGVKLHPDMQKFHIDDPKAYPIYELCEERGLPILMHMGDPRFDFSHPDRLYRVMRDFPELTVVGAHMGGWANWDYACDRLAGLKNLYVDTSSSIAYPGKHYGIEPEVISLDADHAVRLIRAWGVDKVLYGTDYPMWSQEADIEAFFALGLTEAENRAILSQNAVRVFGIKGNPQITTAL